MAISPLVSALGLPSVSPTQTPASTAAQPGRFLDLLSQALDKVNDMQGQAATTTHDFQLSRNGATLEDAMIASQKANIAFQATVQVRNKLVNAYNDIMNMPV